MKLTSWSLGVILGYLWHLKQRWFIVVKHTLQGDNKASVKCRKNNWIYSKWLPKGMFCDLRSVSSWETLTIIFFLKWFKYNFCACLILFYIFYFILQIWGIKFQCLLLVRYLKMAIWSHRDLLLLLFYDLTALAEQHGSFNACIKHTPLSRTFESSPLHYFIRLTTASRLSSEKFQHVQEM